MVDIASVPQAAQPARRLGRPGPLWLCVPGFIFLAAFFLAPTLQMLSVSLFDPKTGAIGLESFARLFGSSVYARVLANTFAIALQVTLLSTLLGYPLAYWLASQSVRRQRITLLFVLLPFWTSALVKNFAWLVLLGRNGLVADLLAGIGLSGGDELLHGRGTVLFAMVHTMLPLAVVTMLPILNGIDTRLTRAAMTLGASSGEAFWRIYAPLSLRGVATAGLLVFVGSLGFFITPALVGGRQDTMISQLIIMQINQLQNWRFGSTLAVVLVLAALLAIFLYDRVFGLSAISKGGAGVPQDGRMRRFGLSLAAFIGRIAGPLGEAWSANIKGLGGRAILSLYCWLLIAVLLFPIIGLIPMAFTSSTFLGLPTEGLSLRWFETYATSPLWISATLRSFGVGIATAALTLCIAGLAAFGLARSQSRFVGLAFLLFLAPMVVPPIVIAIALFYLFAQLHLVATDIAIVIGHTVIALPIVFVVMLATFKAHDWRLDDVARTLGASRRQVLRRVTLPLVKGGLVVGLVTGFLQSFEELTVALFIGGGLKTTLPKQMWDDVLLQANPTIAAASVVVLSIVVLLFVIMEVTRPTASRAAS